MYFNDNYDESESTVLQARNKRDARKVLIKRTASDQYEKIEIDTIYETSSDARP